MISVSVFTVFICSYLFIYSIFIYLLNVHVFVRTFALSLDNCLIFCFDLRNDLLDVGETDQNNISTAGYFDERKILLHITLVQYSL